MNLANQTHQFRIVYVNAFLCIQLCLSIFGLKYGRLVLKVKCGTVLLMDLGVCFFYSEIGHELEILAEKIRDSLYEVEWIGKPIWLQRSLLLMMIRNTKLPVFGVMNLVTISRRNMTNVMQAAYSYFNLLNSLL